MYPLPSAETSSVRERCRPPPYLGSLFDTVKTTRGSYNSHSPVKRKDCFNLSIIRLISMFHKWSVSRFGCPGFVRVNSLPVPVLSRRPVLSLGRLSEPAAPSPPAQPRPSRPVPLPDPASLQPADFPSPCVLFLWGH